MNAFTIVKSACGSRPWFAVPAGAEAHPMNAAWLRAEGDGVIHTQDGPVQTDGRVRFFARKRDVVAAIAREAQ